MKSRPDGRQATVWPRSLLLTCALLSAGITWAEEPAKRPARRWSLDPRAQLAASPRTSDREDVLRFQRDVCGHREAEFDMPRKDEKRDHIFVSVASYRDDSCKRTIADLFAKADHPERITVGVVQQNQAGTAEDCVAGCPSCVEQQKRGRIVVKDYDYTEARGPAYARWAASRLWDGSEFFLQIDAHSSFQPGWDGRIVEQYRALGDPKAVLTHHPPADGAMASVLARGRTTLNCRAEFDDDGIFAPRARAVAADGELRSPFAAGGFLFLPGRVLHEVPWDPYLVFLFHPEEALSSARLWTAGFNLYAPRVPVISHTYHQHRRGPGGTTSRLRRSRGAASAPSPARGSCWA
jgi:hypothetical protein